MTGPSVELKTDVSGLQALMDGLLKHVSKEAIGKAIGLKLVSWTSQNFKQQGALIQTGGWKKLSERTIAKRRKGSSNILNDTGRLKQSYDLYSGEHGIIKGNRVTVGTNDKRAPTHQYGLNKVPQRRMLPEGPQAKGIIRPMLEAALKKAVKDARN